MGGEVDRPSGRVSAASAAKPPHRTAVRVSSSRPSTAARTSTAARLTTARARRAFSSPLVVQMTKDGMAAVMEPATRATSAGRLEIARAIERNPANTPRQHSSASVFGNRTRSGAPSQVPVSNRRNQRPTTSSPNQAGLENPSTGDAPGWSTGPAPVARDRA